MKIKNFKAFIASVLAFAIIGIIGNYRQKKIKGKKKSLVNQKIEKINLKNVYKPIPEDKKILTKPEIIYEKLQ